MYTHMYTLELPATGAPIRPVGIVPHPYSLDLSDAIRARDHKLRQLPRTK
jgi:hypothetical protein